MFPLPKTNRPFLNDYNTSGSLIKSLFLFFLLVVGSWGYCQTTITYSTPGTYTFTVPYGVTSVTVELWGAGGAGGGAYSPNNGNGNNSRGGGGGGGAYKKVTLSGLTPGTTYSLTVGSGGTVVSGGNGNNGDNSTFDGQSANGGQGGKYQLNGNAFGGAGANGDQNGGDGASATSSGSGGGGGGAGNAGNGADGAVIGGGAGGSGGGGAGGNGQTSNNNGITGIAPGGGGSGGFRSTGTNKQSGGDGGDGQIIVSFTLNCATQNIWIGGTSTDWFTASNWCSGIPTSSSNVYIPAVGKGPVYQPSIGAGTPGAVCKNITIDGTLTTTGTNNLNVYGDWINNGSFTPNTGSITFMGNSSNIIGGSATTTFNQLNINKGTAYSVTNGSSAKVFNTTNDLTVTAGTLVLQAFNTDYAVGGNLNIPSGGTLSHGVDWNTYGKSLNVSGNIVIDGKYTYSVPRATVRMVGTGSKTVRTGISIGSAFSIFLLQDGNYSPSGTIKIQDNFWPMFGTTGSFTISAYTVTANAGMLMNNGSVTVNGGTLNVTGGLYIGHGNSATLNLSSGTLTADNVLVGSSSAGIFNVSGGTLNATNLNIGNSAAGTLNFSGGTPTLGNVVIGNGSTGTFTITNSPVINLTGNWTNNGTFTPATGQINFTGSTTQLIGGSNATTFFIANKTTTNTVQLNKDVTISNNFTFKGADILDINGNTFEVKGELYPWVSPGSFKGSSTSNLILRNASNGGAPTINFVSGSQSLYNLTLYYQTILGTPLTIYNNVSINNCWFKIGNNDLTLNSSATITPTGGDVFRMANMVATDGTGKLVKKYSAIGSFTYPIGNSTGTPNYSPVTLPFSTGTFGTNASVGINVVASKHPNNTSTTGFISRYWNVSPTDITNYTASPVFSYVTGDVTGTESLVKTAGFASDNAWYMGNNANTGTHTLAFTNDTDLNKSYTGVNFPVTPAASYFRTIFNGNWSTIANWQSSADSITWIPSTIVPTSAAKRINILLGDTVLVNSSITLGKAQVFGVLNLVNSGIITLANAADALAIRGGGVFNILTTGTYASTFVPSGGAVTVDYLGKITIGDGSMVVGSGFDALADSGGNNKWGLFAIFEWNTSTAPASVLTYFNDATLFPVLRLTKFPATISSAYALAVNGILEVNTPFSISAPTLTCVDGILGSSTLTQTSGTFIISRDGALLGGSNLALVLNGGGLNITGNTSEQASDNNKLTISGTGNVTVASGKTFTINGTADFTDRNISGTGGIVTVSSTGTYRTSHAGGFSGTSSSLTTTGTNLLSSGSTVELYASGNQNLNSRADFSNLIFSGSGTKSLLGSSFNPVGTVTIKDNAIVNSGAIDMGNGSTNLTMTDNSRFILNNTGVQPTISGTYSLTGAGSVIQFNGTSAQTIRGTGITYNQIEVSGAGVSNTTQNITLKSGGKFTVNNLGIYTANDNTNTITGSGSSVVVLNGGTINTANATGLNGGTSTAIHSSIKSIDLQTGSTVNYNKSGAQTITIPNVIGYSNLTLSGLGNKTAPATTLNILGNFSKTTSAVFVHNGGTVSFNGAVAQTITNTAAPEILFNNFSNNNKVGLDVKDSISIYRKLSMGSNAKLTLTKNITLKSDASNTANVGVVPSDAIFTYGASGKFIVERYFPNHKAWHFLSVPTKGSQFKSAWQEGNDALVNITKPGYGIMLTGTAGTIGYDYPSPQPSLKYFDNAKYKYVELRRTDSLMDNLGGYMVFIKGNRGILPTKDSTSSTTLRTKGTIYAPGAAPSTISVKKDSFALIGNPYPSAIDFSQFTTTNLTGTYYIWDPNLTSGYGYGAFQTINSGVVTPGGGGYSGAGPFYIQSGQSFFVKASSSAIGSVFIPETAKVDGNTVSVFRTGTQKVNALAPATATLRAQLLRILSGQPILIDGVISLFNKEYDNQIDEWDAEKLTNLNTENMGINSHGKVLAIERKDLPKDADTIFYKMNNYKIAPYRFQFIADKLDVSGQDAFLYDKYLNTFTPVSPNDTTVYDFTITNATGSWDETRFSIVFKNSKTTPVTLTNLKAYTQNKDIVVEWKVENESNMRSYTVETSTDGKTFTKGGTVAAKNVSATTYQWLDVDVKSGYHYYRILSSELDGKSSYSKIVRVLVGANSNASKITIYPNPIKDGVINLQFENQEAGIYQLRLLNTVGQVMMTKTINHPGGSSSELLMLNSTITRGIYHLEITKGGARVMSEKVVY